MADLESTDLTYTEQGRPGGRLDHQGNNVRIWKITTAAGEYPTGGLPLDNGQMGCPNELLALRVLDESQADTYQYLWDKGANTIKVLVDDGSSGVPAEHGNTTFTSPDELIVESVGW